MLTCLEEIVAYTHNSCICLILVCCVSYCCALMLIFISSCMLVWLLIALSIALSCIALDFLHCKGHCSKRSTKRCSKRCSEQHPQDLMQKWFLNASDLMHFEWALYERCTEALFVQRPSQTREFRLWALYRSALCTAPKANIRPTYQNDHTLIWPPLYMPLWL